MISVSEVAFWGFWGLVCIEKWSRNFDLSKIYFSALDYWSRPQVVEDIRLVFALQENKENTRLVGRKMLRL